jgi:hypothetical protein
VIGADDQAWLIGRSYHAIAHRCCARKLLAAPLGVGGTTVAWFGDVAAAAVGGYGTQIT